MVGCGMASLDVSARMAAEEESKNGPGWGANGRWAHLISSASLDALGHRGLFCNQMDRLVVNPSTADPDGTVHIVLSRVDLFRIHEH